MKVSGCYKVLGGLIYHITLLSKLLEYLLVSIESIPVVSMYHPFGLWGLGGLLGFSFSHHFCTLGVRGTLTWDTGIPFIIFRVFLCGSNELTVHILCVLMNVFTWTLGTTEVVLGKTVVLIAASFRCIIFLLYSPCDVSTIYDLVVSALDLTSPWLHLWLVESCAQLVR